MTEQGVVQPFDEDIALYRQSYLIMAHAVCVTDTRAGQHHPLQVSKEAAEHDHSRAMTCEDQDRLATTP